MKLEKVRRNLEKGKTKKKCCRSKKRCCSCPVVCHRLRKDNALDLDDKALKKAIAKARKW
ncbi:MULTISPECIES: hypothetical protein [Corynebacterium]|uniref:hypothetical protein n=1 Tax=Corynebacterium TaxID=1716 RepID=UPI00124CD5D3|nr:MULTISPECIES: hypothetical protein [Corynebacterium]